MTKKEYLIDLLNKIAKETQMHTSWESAKEDNQSHYLRLDNNPTYGGWCMELVNIEHWAVRDAFHFNCSTRYKYKIMKLMLESFYQGLVYEK